MTVKTITFTIDARYDAQGMASDLQDEHPELLAFTVLSPFDIKGLDVSASREYANNCLFDRTNLDHKMST